MKRHWLAFVLAFLVGVISIAPQLYAYRDANYKGIQMFGADAEYDYVAKMNQGFSDAGKPVYLAPQLGERFMGSIARMSHARVIEVNVAFKFLSAVALFLILYGMLLEIFGLRMIAILGPLLVMLGITILNFKIHVDTFLPYTRPISPQLSSILLFLGMWGTYRIATRPTRYRLAIFLGLLTALSLYVYIYTWAFLMGLLGLYALYHIAKRHWPALKPFAVSIGVSMAGAIPFLVNAVHARGNADYLDTGARIGLIHTHMPLVGLWLLGGIILVALLWPREQQRSKYFFLASFSALVILLNQQIITGIRLQPGHFQWYFIKPLVAITIVVVGWYWAGKFVSRLRYRVILGVLAGMIFFANGIYVQAYSYRQNYDTFLHNQQAAWVMNFLNSTYPDKKTIWADHDLSTLIEAYTHHTAPNKTMAPYYLDSREHLRDMLFLEYRLRDITPDIILRTLQQERDYVTGRIFGIYYRDLPGSHTLPDAYLEQLAEQYKIFYATPVGIAYKKLGIDIFITDRPHEGLSIHQVIPQ